MSNENEEAVLVCAEADHVSPPFADNTYGQCQGGCGREIMWRPYNGDPKLRKLCYRCALSLAAKAKADGDEVVVAEPTGLGRLEISEWVSQKQLEDTLAAVKTFFGVKEDGDGRSAKL